MKSRLIIAAIFIPVLLVFFIFLPKLAMPILFAIISLVTVYELLSATKLVRNIRVLIYSLLVAVLMPFWAYFGSNAHVGAVGIFIYVLLLFMEFMTDYKRVDFEKLMATAFLSMFIPYLLAAFVRIIIEDLGRYYVLVPLMIPFVCDAGAYFVGMNFGRHKLAPELSPKKSIEGAVGGLVASVLACLIYGAIMLLFDLKVNFILFVVYGLLGGVVTEVGDLCFSSIKRRYNIKDFGHLLGGHGGFVDRFDSVIFAAPFIEMLIFFIPALAF